MPTFSSSNSPDIYASGSRLLSLESPNLASDSSYPDTGHGGDDLSLSDLSISRTPVMPKPFSLLAKPPHPETPTQIGPNEDADRPDEAEEEPVVGEVAQQDQEVPEKLREEKLQSDIFILKKLNASFELFNEALQETGTANERIASQLQQTDALLNRYIGILAKSEEFARLIFDERWQGAEADEEAMKKARQEALERARREAEEREAMIQREQQRLEQEQLEQRRKEKERLERERAEKTSREGMRGVRGTRASMRGVRGSVASRPVEPTPSSSRGIPKRTSIARGASNIARGASRPSS